MLRSTKFLTIQNGFEHKVSVDGDLKYLKSRKTE